VEVSWDSPGALVQGIRDGERSAEEELVQRYSRGVFFFINQSVSDRTVAEDLYQESFRIMLEKVRAGALREPERLSGFISSLVRNLVIDYFRRTSRQQAREDDNPEQQPIPSPEPSQLDQLLRKEQGLLALRVLEALPSDRDRKVLYRFYIADDEKEEICTDLGVSALHFNQILFRARERYRKLFEDMKSEKKISP
jgi:RNA polymerase sigma-70 factor (ECF subfamily)